MRKYSILQSVYLLFFKCNNPMTKEPKLAAAVRIVPEWKDYDNEIKSLMDTWQLELKQNASRKLQN